MGHVYAEDLGKVETLEKVELEPEVINEEEAVFVTIIPHYLHCEKRCKDAKQK